MALTILQLPDGRYGFRKPDGTFLYTHDGVLAFDTLEQAQKYISPPVAANIRLIKASTGKEQKHGDETD